MEQSDKFETWAVVEVMGHNRFAGLVTEQAIGGCAFVRVDVPAVGDHDAYTKLLGQGSIYAITPCSEAVARQVAKDSYTKPVNVYAPQLQSALTFESGDRDDGDLPY